MFWRIYDQPLLDWYRFLTRYLNWSTPSTSSLSCLTFRMNYIPPDWCANSTSLLLNCISAALTHLLVWLCFFSISTGMCMPKLSHLGDVNVSYCIISILSFQWLYIKCPQSRTVLCIRGGNSSTRHVTAVRMFGNDTTYVSVPPPLTSTPYVFIIIFLWILSK